MTFTKDNDVIVYTFEKVLSYARRNQQIFLAQCIWWLASVIGLDRGLIIHIINLRLREEIDKSECRNESELLNDTSTSCELEQPDIVLNECEEYMHESQQLRDIANLRTAMKAKTSHINPIKASKRILPRSTRKAQSSGNNISKTEGIPESEINRKKLAEEWLRCAWPINRKGGHRVVRGSLLVV
jgi:hypothetical protein